MILVRESPCQGYAHTACLPNTTPSTVQAPTCVQKHTAICFAGGQQCLLHCLLYKRMKLLLLGLQFEHHPHAIIPEVPDLCDLGAGESCSILHTT